MQVVVAPDSFGGTLSARQAAAAIAMGWRASRPDDVIVEVPMSDGGEGLLDVLARADDRWLTTEVAGPHGHPIDAALLLRPDGSAVVESAAACGLDLLPAEQRTPMLATSYGVGQLLDAARRAGAHRILVGLGGSAMVDGGAGALTALGFRLRVASGAGLKIGGDDLHRIARIERGWAADWGDIAVDLAADVTTTLRRAATEFGPQKGATPQDVEVLVRALDVWADVVARDLTPGSDLRDESGSGAAGGLGFGLAAALGARLVSGSSAIADAVGLPSAVADADLVVTGEGRLDATTAAGKVVAHVEQLSRRAGVQVMAVVGQRGHGGPTLDDIEVAAPGGPGDDPAAELSAAAERLAARVWARRAL